MKVRPDREGMGKRGEEGRGGGRKYNPAVSIGNMIKHQSLGVRRKVEGKPN